MGVNFPGRMSAVGLDAYALPTEPANGVGRVVLLCTPRLQIVVREVARSLEELGVSALVATPEDVEHALPPGQVRTVLVACSAGPEDAPAIARAEELARDRAASGLRMLAAELDITFPLQIVKPIYRFATFPPLDRRTRARTQSSISALLPSGPFGRLHVTPLTPGRPRSVDSPDAAPDGVVTPAGGRLSRFGGWVPAIVCSLLTAVACVLLQLTLGGVAGFQTVPDAQSSPDVEAGTIALPPAAPPGEPTGVENAPAPRAVPGTLRVPRTRRPKKHARVALPVSERGRASWDGARTACRSRPAENGERWRLPTWRELRDLRRSGKLAPGRYWSDARVRRRPRLAHALDTRQRAFISVPGTRETGFVCVRAQPDPVPDTDRTFAGPLAVQPTPPGE